MKRLIVIVTLSLAAFHAEAVELPKEVPRIRMGYIPDVFYQEEGFKLGNVLTFSEPVGWRYEGKFQLGFDSSPTVRIDAECERDVKAEARKLKKPANREAALRAIKNCVWLRNPWYFSVTSDETAKKISGTDTGKPVVLYYVRPANRAVQAFSQLEVTAYWTNTRDYVRDVFAVDPKRPMSKRYTAGGGPLAEETSIFDYSGEFAEGRVIQASMVDPLRKTFEIVFQQGTGGTNYLQLSVDDNGIFDHLVMSMLNGKPIRVYYKTYYAYLQGWWSHLRGYRTLRRVTGILSSDAAAEANP